MKAEHCAKCGEEVRFGVRDGVTKWWHREAVDHEAGFGVLWTPAVDQRAPTRQVAEERIFDIPEPEVRNLKIGLGDDRMPGGASGLIKAQQKAHPDGSWLATYSRGPRTHSAYGNLLGVSDFTMVKFAPNHDVMVALFRNSVEAVALWRRDDKKWVLDTAYLLDYARHRRVATKTTSSDIRKRITS